MTGVIKIKCPKCKKWMRKRLDLCDDCRVTQVRIEEE